MANKKNPKPFLVCNFSEMSGSVHQLVVGNEIFSTGEGLGWTHKLIGWLLKGFSPLNIFSNGTWGHAELPPLTFIILSDLLLLITFCLQADSKSGHSNGTSTTPCFSEGTISSGYCFYNSN